MADPLEVYLNGVQAPKSVKADAWDAYQSAQGPGDFQSKFDKIDLPKNIKADLWDLKHTGKITPGPDTNTLGTRALGVMDKYAAQPFEKMASAGSAYGQQVMTDAMAQMKEWTDPTAPKGVSPAADKAIAQQIATEHPAASGTLLATGSVVGGMVADPRNWPFLGSSSARPLLQKAMTIGFTGMMGKGVHDSAKDLYQNWDNLTPQQRDQKLAETGIYAAMTAATAGHLREQIKAPVEAQASTQPVPLKTPPSEVKPAQGKWLTDLPEGIANKQVMLGKDIVTISAAHTTNGQVRVKFADGRERATAMGNLKPLPKPVPGVTPEQQVANIAAPEAQAEDAIEQARRRAPAPEPVVPAPNQVPIEQRASTQALKAEQGRQAERDAAIQKAKEANAAPFAPGSKVDTPPPVQTPVEGFGHAERNLANIKALQDAVKDERLQGETNKQRQARLKGETTISSPVPTSDAGPKLTDIFSKREDAELAANNLVGPGKYIIKTKAYATGKQEFTIIPKEALPAPPQTSRPKQAPLSSSPEAKPQEPVPQAVPTTPASQPVVGAEEKPLKVAGVPPEHAAQIAQTLAKTEEHLPAATRLAHQKSFLEAYASLLKQGHPKALETILALAKGEEPKGLPTGKGLFHKAADYVSKLTDIDSTRGSILRTPKFLQSVFEASPESSVRTFVSHTDPALRDTVARIGGTLSVEPRAKMPDFRGSFQADRNLFAVKTRTRVQRIVDAIQGKDSFNETLAHETGHGVWEKLDKDISTNKLQSFYPDATLRIKELYGNKLEPGSNRYRHEIFAEAFKHWYEGRVGNDIGFEKLLRSNPEVWDAVKDLKGRGQDWSSSDYKTNAEVVYGAMIGAPNHGLPVPETFRALADWSRDKLKDTFKPSDYAKGFLRQHYSEADIAMQRYYANLRDDINRLDGYSKADLRNWMDIGEGKPGAVNNLDPKDQQVMDYLRKELDAKRDIIEAKRPGTFEHFIENYFPHVWEKPGVAKRVLQSMMVGKKTLSGGKSFLKPRFYEFLSDGLDAGLTPATNNPIKMSIATLHQMDRFIAGISTFDDLKANKLIKFANSPSKLPATHSDWRPIDDPIFNPKGAYITKGVAVPVVGRYYAPPDIANTINTYLKPGLRGNIWFDPLRSAGNTLNMLNLGMSAYHATFSGITNGAYNMALGIEKITSGHKEFIGSGLKDIAKGAAQGTTAPFTLGLTSMRDIMFGSAIRKTMIDPNMYPHLAKLSQAYIDSGGRYGQDAFYKNSAIDKFWKNVADNNWAKAGLKAMPAVIEYLSKPIMDHMVPNLKAAAFSHRAEFLMRKAELEGWSQPQLMRELDRASDIVDNQFGQMVYDNTFWNKTAKDVGMMMVRSVGWNMGNLRDVKMAAEGLGREAFKVTQGKRPTVPFQVGFMASLPLVVGFAGAAYMYMHGTRPTELQDYIYWKTGEKDADGKDVRVNAASYVKDWVGTVHDPKNTFLNKLHPLVQMSVQTWRNEDYFNTEIRHPEDNWILPKEGDSILDTQVAETATYLGKSALPFSVSNAIVSHTQGTGIMGELGSAAGITPAPKWISRSPAENYAFERSYRHLEQSKTADEFNYRQYVGKLESAFYGGRDPGGQAIQEAFRSGKLRDVDMNRIFSEQKTPPLQRAMSRLTVEEIYHVWELASPSERAQIRPQMEEAMDSKIGNMVPSEQPKWYKRYTEALMQ